MAALSATALELIAFLVRAGTDWFIALKLVNNMDEKEIEAGMAYEEARTDQIMARWRAK
ncbi:hypothetical protein LCGC14_1170020 [marine sediment metagenome]|uniref:Uncharacterized protein n=1 Tax=marine sediment metagenome TaxID=412755 RepID=A0A0F9LQ61_9ZZZZ